MGEFFKGRKRKVGVVTLVMACLFMGGWVRSYSNCDSIRVSYNRCLASYEGVISMNQIHFSPCTYWSFSYLYIVLPLTLLSAYLLLSKPRKSTQTKTAPPNQDEGRGVAS